jgi:hypothetical protein
MRTIALIAFLIFGSSVIASLAFICYELSALKIEFKETNAAVLGIKQNSDFQKSIKNIQSSIYDLKSELSSINSKCESIDSRANSFSAIFKPFGGSDSLYFDIKNTLKESDLNKLEKINLLILKYVARKEVFVNPLTGEIEVY